MARPRKRVATLMISFWEDWFNYSTTSDSQRRLPSKRAAMKSVTVGAIGLMITVTAMGKIMSAFLETDRPVNGTDKTQTNSFNLRQIYPGFRYERIENLAGGVNHKLRFCSDSFLSKFAANSPDCTGTLPHYL